MSTSSCFCTAPFPVCGPSLEIIIVFGGLLPTPSCCKSPPWVRCQCRFAICGFPRGFSFIYRLLSSLLPLLPAVPLGSSFPFVAFSSFLVCHSASFLGGFSSYRVGSLSLWLFPVRYLLRSCWGYLPCVLRVLLFLASFGYVLVFFLFTSFVTRLNLSSFATRSSLRAESPLSVVACLISHGFGSCPLVFGMLPLLGSLLYFLLLFVEWVTLCSAGSSLEFLYLSLFVAGLHFPSAFVFVSLTPFCCSLLLGGFLSTLLKQLPFSLVLFTCGCSCYTFPLICCTSFLIIGGGTLVSSLASSLRSSASILQCLLGRCAWLRHLSPLVRCVHGDSYASSPP